MCPRSPKQTSSAAPGGKKTTQVAGKKGGFLHKWNILYGVSLVILAVTMSAIWNKETTFKVYDPYEVLGVSQFSTDEQVTKAFKLLGRKYHPDKATDKEEAEKMFLEITKAYKTLTDPVARKNWEDFGNPDGAQQSSSLGIALPSWLVDKAFGPWVLAFYMLCFMIGVPYLVSKSWTHSKLYTKDQILHSTMAVYFQQLKDSMSLKKIFDLLATSLEFKSEFTVRPSDPAAIDKLIDEINAQIETSGNGGEKYEKAKWMTEFWMIKAHVLLWAHVNRYEVNNSSLKQDQEKMVVKACHLTLGMLQIALARQWLQTASQCISMVQCLVQAVWEGQSSLLQLPYVDSQIVKHAKGKKNPIRTVRQLVELPEEDRRSLLRTLSDEQYKTLIDIAKTFPEVVITSASFVTLGQPHVIPGGLVTVKIKLRLVKAGDELPDTKEEEADDSEVENFEFDEDGNLIDSAPLKSIGAKDEATLPRPIYCPRFPNEKRPYWWVVLTNVANTNIVTPPIKVTDLADSKVVTLQFTAPPRPGQIAVNVHVKSDCLVGVDVFKTCHITILPMKEAPAPSWGISGEDSDGGYSMGGSGGGGCGSGCGHSH